MPTETEMTADAIAIVEGLEVVDVHPAKGEVRPGGQPQGFQRLVHYLRTVEHAMGDGVKRVYPSEIQAMARLRRAG